VAVNNIIPHRQNSVMIKFCDAAMMMLSVGAHCLVEYCLTKRPAPDIRQK
jgi:hypothetical protein